MKIRICLGIIVIASLASKAAAGGPRCAAPDAATELTLRQAVQHQYSDLYSSTEPAEQLALAKTLLQAVPAAESTQSTGEAFALLCEARDATARGGDMPGALRIANSLFAKYELTLGSARVGALAAAAQTVSGQQQDAWFSILLGVVDQAMLNDDFSAARRMLDIGAETAANRQADYWSQPLAIRQSDLDIQYKAYIAIKPAIDQLRRSPNDPNLNYTVGKYECFIKGDWQPGLLLLDHGIDEQTHQAARMEIWEPKNSELQAMKAAKNGRIQIMVADRWQALRESNPDPILQLDIHTYDWYLRALPFVPEMETADRSYVETALKKLIPLVESHRPNAALWVTVADAISRKAIAPSAIVGGKKAGETIQNIPETGGLLVGFHVGLAMLNGDKVITYLQPIYDTPLGERDGPAIGRLVSKVQTLHAPAGYAIGAMRLSGDAGLNSITAWYMRIAGDHLNITDRLKPVQVGGTGGTPSTFGGRGLPIIGISGKQKDGYLGLGLIFTQPINLAGAASASVK